MPLHFVGENLDKSRSHYRAETGELVQLMRGIYVDAGDDIDALVQKHAVRIAKYLYPKAYLSAASAQLLGPTSDGRLFISARRNQRTRIRALEIIQNPAPKHPSVVTAVINDGMGEFHISVSSARQRFLEAFRLRSEHAASLDAETRTTTATRLIEEYGGRKEAADAVWALARENEWYREGEYAERFLLHPAAAAIRNDAAFDLVVAWHGIVIGHLRHDGFEWRWNPSQNGGPPLIRQTTPGKLPPFISSLLPEGWLETVLKDKDERTLLRSGKRYTSNITIVEKQSNMSELPSDTLSCRRLCSPATALVRMPGNLPPALIVERFDIRQGLEDKTMLAMEDLCSVLDLPKEAKYDGTMERVARAIRPLSTAPEEDLRIVLKRALFAWLIADGDMHLKNMALLKTAEPGDKQFRTVRMAPLYDAVTTRVFPNLKHDRMALKLNGKDHNLRRGDFRKLASTAGLKTAAADTAIDEMLHGMASEIDRVSLPALEYGAEGQDKVKEMLGICHARIESLA